MRFCLLLAILPLPVAAWDFTATPVCTLSHTTGRADVVVTYDPALPEYAISVTADVSWPIGRFHMNFDGGLPIAISSDRHTLSPDGRTLTVRDRGFGNVLNGLEFNTTATARVGTTEVIFPMRGIGPPMTAFRACPSGAPAVS